MHERKKITVAEYIAHLQQLPPDALVLRNWEGELITPRPPRLADCHRFQDSTSASEDYFPECTDEDYTQFKAVVLE